MLIFLIYSVTANLFEKCHLDKITLKDSESLVYARFEEQIQVRLFDYQCVELLIRKGYHRVAKLLFESQFMDKQANITQAIFDIRAFFKNDQFEKQRELSRIFKDAFRTENVQTVAPVVQWAQNKNQTYLNLKFSHRQDAPACLNCRLDKVEFLDDILIVQASGVVSHIPVRYHYEIVLFDKIIPELCNYKVEAVGTMALNLTKVESKIWIRLTKDDYKTAIWWDLKDKIGSDMNEFVQLLEKQSEIRENKAEKSYKKLKKDKEKNQIQKPITQIPETNNQCYIVQYVCGSGWYQRQ